MRTATKHLSAAALAAAQEELRVTGKVVIRDAPIAEAAQVSSLAALVWGNDGSQFMPKYSLGVTSRNEVGKGVFEVNLEPPELPVTQHTEMSYLDQFPGFIAFFAKRAATSGGRTVVSDNLAVTRDLPSWFGERLRREGVQYHRRLACEEAVAEAAEYHRPPPPAYKSWQSAFGTSSREEAQAAVDAATDTLAWRDSDGSLSWKSLRPAYHRVVRGQQQQEQEQQQQQEQQQEEGKEGQEVLMNQVYTLHASLIDHATEIYRPYAGLDADEQPYTARWGSGEDFEDADIRDLGDLIASHSQTVDLRSGDLVILDNRRWGHGREPYDGGPREILVAMSPPVTRRTDHVPPGLEAARYAV